MKLTDDQKERLRKNLRWEIDDCLSTKKDQVPWWAEVRKMKLGRAQDQSVQIIKGMQGFYFALYRPKRNGVIDTTYSAFTSLSPTVQIIDPSQDGANMAFAEKGCQNLAAKGGFAREFKDALGWAIDVNLGTLRIRPLPDENGDVTSIETKSIDPMRMIGWPPAFKEYDQLKTVGHCYFDLVARVREKCEDGTFDLVEDPAKIIGGANPAEFDLSQVHAGTSRTSLNRNNESLDPLDRWCCIFQVVTEFAMEEGNYKRDKLSVFYDYTTDLILSVDPFGSLDEYGDLDTPYPCWYVPVRMTWDSDEGLWPEDSIGRPNIGLQLAYNKNMNTIQQGGMFASFGFHIISGGAMKTKVIKMTPGGAYETPAEVKISSVNFPFNPQNLQFVNQIIERIVDTLMGRTQLGTGANVAASTSATAINALQQAQSEAKDGYIDTVAPAVARAYELYWTFLKIHYGTLRPAMPKDLDIPNWDQVKDLKPDFQVTGQSSASNPQALAQKLQMVLGMFAQPLQVPPGSQFDINKIQLKLIEAMNLPFSTKQIMHTILHDQTGMMADIAQQLIDEGNNPHDIKRAFMIHARTLMEAGKQAAAAAQQAQQGMNAGPQANQGQPGQLPSGPPSLAAGPPSGGGQPPQESPVEPPQAPPSPGS